jgi:hypothetical protein
VSTGEEEYSTGFGFWEDALSGRGRAEIFSVRVSPSEIPLAFPFAGLSNSFIFKGDPQVRQNFFSSGYSVPHFGQKDITTSFNNELAWLLIYE